MHLDPTTKSASLGKDLRALRRARGLTLSDAATSLDRSVGWLSQVERDLSSPSVADLQALAQLLDVPMSILFGASSGPSEEAGIIVRKNARRTIPRPVEGLYEELLSPDLTDDFEMVHSTFEPGSHVTESVLRPTQEVAVMLEGRLDLVIDGWEATVGPGDSFRLRGVPFTWSNPYAEAAVAIWVIAPPVY
ncbi:MAG: helix-turn-helix domain-containing protein [Pseudomonadota bacterium]